MWQTNTVHPLKLNCNTSNSRWTVTYTAPPPLPCHCRSTSGPLPPPCQQTPGPTSHSPASPFALQTRSTSPQPTRASQDSTCPCIHQSSYSELSFCRQSPPRCLGLCRWLKDSHGRLQCTCTCVVGRGPSSLISNN